MLGSAAHLCINAGGHHHPAAAASGGGEGAAGLGRCRHALAEGAHIGGLHGAQICGPGGCRCGVSGGRSDVAASATKDKPAPRLLKRCGGWLRWLDPTICWQSQRHAAAEGRHISQRLTGLHSWPRARVLARRRLLWGRCSRFSGTPDAGGRLGGRSAAAVFLELVPPPPPGTAARWGRPAPPGDALRSRYACHSATLTEGTCTIKQSVYEM